MSDEMTPEGTEDNDFDALLKAAKRWSELHMDQWEKLKFKTEYGVVYLSLTRETLFPDDFDEVTV
jgi:hypothetical protein